MKVMYDNFMKVVKKFTIILYARLSKEEEGKSKEEKSRSIQNQIQIGKEFIEEEMKEYKGIIEYEIVAILCDDGVSGTTFDRDDFNKAIKMIENGEANMIVTKDLSRLGRDHVQADNYIEKWFPEHNVRYVAILDNVDTYVPDNNSNDIAPIKTWMDEMYAKGISKKIKRTFKLKIKEGLWTGGEPPIGYQLDPKVKGHFIIEPKGADIVKRIFNLAKENQSVDGIADILINDKIPIPTLIKGNKRNINTDLIDLWSSDTINRILQNEVYLGHMIQGKTTRLNHKSKKIVYIPKEEWIRVENTHEPIIDKETFDIVQLLIKSNKNKTTKTHDYLLKGMLFCAECGHAIGIQHYKERTNNYTICNYYRKYGSKKEVCTAHRFVYEELEKLVIDNIKSECMQYVDSTNFDEKLKDKNKTKQLQTELKLKIDKCNREVSKINNQIDTIYEDKLNGIITEEQYKRLVKSKHDTIEYEMKNIELYQQELNRITDTKVKEPNYSKIVKEFLSLKKPNKIIITELIDKILINEEGVIDIHYKIQNPYKNISTKKDNK